MAVFDLEAIIRLNDSGFKQGLSKAGKAIGTFAKVTGAAVAAGAAGVAALATQSVNAYADYQQLAGGVEKLFGNGGKSLREYANATGKTINEVAGEWRRLERAQNLVLQNAENAYVSAGMSANEYIENVTGISAALVNSYGGDTQKAAEQADKAMRAISDNFNTFGGDISSVQAAYQGFAKQNYTMLDNLKLGYGGTKTEMERLIKDANQYREELGLTGDLTIEKYGDVVEAIDLIQQKQGIAGTTAKEAATTISGSLNMTKAAWKNLVRAFSDKDADLSKYFDNLVTSAETAFNNILPVAEQAIKGIGQMVTDLAPVIGEKLPGIISSVLPNLVKSGASLVTSVLTGFATAAPAIVEAIPEVVKGIKDGFVASWPALKEAGGKMLDMVGEGLKAAGPALLKLGGQIMEKLGPVFSNAWTSIKNTAEKYLPGITSLMSQTWSMISSGAKKAWSGITTFFGDTWSTIRSVFGEHSGQLSEGMSNIWAGISERWQSALDGLTSFWDTWGETITTAASSVWETLSAGFEAGLTILSDVFSIFSAAFAGDWSATWEGIKQLGADIWTSIGDSLSSVWDGISQTAQAAWTGVIGPFLSQTWQGLKDKAKGAFDKVAGVVSTTWDTIKGGVSTAWDGIKGEVSAAWEKVKSGAAWESISAKATEAWDSFKGTVTGAWEGIGSEVSTAWETLKGAVSWASISEKGTEAWNALKGTVSGAFTSIQAEIEQAWNTVKGALNFQLPDFVLGLLPKLPKISITGSFSLFPPSVPTISWNAKAMKNPYMFSDMTLFGAGEAGDEVLYGKAALMTDIRAGVASETDGLTQNLTEILEELRAYLPELARRPVVLDSGALVGGIGFDMDRQLGSYSDMGGRGLSFA